MRLTALRTLTVVVLLAALTAGCQSMTGKSAGQNVDDAKITSTVKAKLVADKAANLTRIDVDTNNGVVSLNGVVDTPEHKLRAEQLTMEASGVRRVVNNLQVKR